MQSDELNELEEKLIMDEASAKEFIKYLTLLREAETDRLKAEARAKRETERQRVNELCAEADALTKNLRLPF